MATVESSHHPAGGTQMQITLDLIERAELLLLFQSVEAISPTQHDLVRSIRRALGANNQEDS